MDVVYIGEDGITVVDPVDNSSIHYVIPIFITLPTPVKLTVLFLAYLVTA